VSISPGRRSSLPSTSDSCFASAASGWRWPERGRGARERRLCAQDRSERGAGQRGDAHGQRQQLQAAQVRAQARQALQPRGGRRPGLLAHLRPRISEGKVGWTIKVSASQRAIRAALAANRRAALTLPLKKIARKVIKANFGSVIVIRRGSNRLYLYKGERFVRRFSVATGQSAYPTPLGHYAIVVKWANPGGIRQLGLGRGREAGSARTWQSARHALDGPVGSGSRHSRHARIGLDRLFAFPRLHSHVHPDAEWLFTHVVVGTQVFIVAQ